MMPYTPLPTNYAALSSGMSRMSPLQQVSPFQSPAKLPPVVVLGSDTTAPSSYSIWRCLGKGASAGTLFGLLSPAALSLSAAAVKSAMPELSGLAHSIVPKVTKESFVQALKEMGKLSLASGASGLIFGTLLGAVAGVVTFKRRS